VVKRANISVFLPTSEKILARVYRVMSFVTVKVPKAPETLCVHASLGNYFAVEMGPASQGTKRPAGRLRAARPAV